MGQFRIQRQQIVLSRTSTLKYLDPLKVSMCLSHGRSHSGTVWIVYMYSLTVGNTVRPSSFERLIGHVRKVAIFGVSDTRFEGTKESV